MELPLHPQISHKRTDGWVSGLNQRFAKPSYGVNSYRGFESRPIRFLFRDNWFLGM